MTLRGRSRLVRAQLLATGFVVWTTIALLAMAAVPFSALAGPLEAIVGVRATIPADARTASVLGTERAGSGVVIGRDGLVLTIGYLILEAETAEILLSDDRALPAEIIAYDYDTGFGLLKSLIPLDIDPATLGNSGALAAEHPVLVASFGGREVTTPAYVVSRRDFAGYWEYLLPDAIFTAPPHHTFGGAGLLGPDGKLLGIGSLFVGDALPDTNQPGNMFVPIDALKPILADLVESGRSRAAAKPWLGLYTEGIRNRLFVNRVAPEGPSATAGLEAEDVILAVKGEPVASQADFYRKVWSLGTAGVAVPLTVLRGAEVTEITVTSGDRYDFLKLSPSH